MHNSDADLRSHTVSYRERLSPSLWLLVSAALAGPMIAVVVAPVNTTLAVALGLAAALLLLALLVFASPVVAVEGDELRVGRAHIAVEHLGTPESLTGDDARLARGPGLRRDAWHLLRGGIDGVVRVPIDDDRDPVGEWVFSSRTPDRVIAAIGRARASS